MKVLHFSFLVLFYNSHCPQLIAFEPLSASAIENTLSKYFINQGNGVDIVHFGNRSGPGNDIIAQVLRSKQQLISTKVTLVTSFSEIIDFNTSTIAIFDSVRIFEGFNTSINWQTNPQRRLKHLVYIYNSSSNDVVENIQDGFTFDSVNFLTNETENSIDLVTLFMFTREKCRSMTLVSINRFLSKKRDWQKSTHYSDFYQNKYENLHNCTLGGDGSGSMVVKILAKHFNFTIGPSDWSGDLKNGLSVIDVVSGKMKYRS